MSDSRDDVDRARRDLARHNERLAAAMRELEAFFPGVADDFELPLGAIESSAIAIGAGRQQPDYATFQAMQAIRDSVAVMQEMIGSLRALGKWAGQPMELESIDMATLARVAWAEIGNNAGAFNLGELPVARGHRGMLALVWKNLLFGAARRSAANARPRVEVSGSRDGENAVYSVSDNGTGLDLSGAGNLLDAFERIQKQSEHPGIAVGLAIVQRIVTRHRGNVWVDARRETGALLQFSLPIAAAK
jgi:light-regulated signal transduction histidine kinase (bacteriophytochrome)